MDETQMESRRKYQAQAGDFIAIAIALGSSHVVVPVSSAIPSCSTAASFRYPSKLLQIFMGTTPYFISGSEEKYLVFLRFQNRFQVSGHTCSIQNWRASRGSARLTQFYSKICYTTANLKPAAPGPVLTAAAPPGAGGSGRGAARWQAQSPSSETEGLVKPWLWLSQEYPVGNGLRRYRTVRHRPITLSAAVPRQPAGRPSAARAAPATPGPPGRVGVALASYDPAIIAGPRPADLPLPGWLPARLRPGRGGRAR
eukprot:2966-Hanusia_phi.AAC.1